MHSKDITPDEPNPQAQEQYPPQRDTPAESSPSEIARSVLSRVQNAVKGTDAGMAVLLLLADPEFIGAMHAGGPALKDIVFKKLRSTGVSKAAFDEASGRYTPNASAQQRDKKRPSLRYPVVEPASNPQDTKTLLVEISSIFEKYVFLPVGAAVIFALWVLHTWTIEAGQFTPRIAVTSATKRCGKTTVLDILRRLSRRALISANVTTAVLYRAIEACRPTLLIDEADTFIQDNDELRGVLNAGFEANGEVLRCVGDNHEPMNFNCFAPVAIAAIGHLPPTIADRSLEIRMERKPSGKAVLRQDRTARKLLDSYPPRLARWAADSVGTLTRLQVAAPEALNDRQRDICEPLLCIAHMAGDEWPLRARQAIVAVCASTGDEPTEVGERLLAAVWALFGDATQFMTLQGIVEALLGDEVGGWDTVTGGRPLTTSQLARLLKRFGVTSVQTRTGDVRRARGFRRCDLAPIAERYLVAGGAEKRDSVTPKESGYCAPAEQPSGEIIGRNDDGHAVTPRNPDENEEGCA